MFVETNEFIQKYGSMVDLVMRKVLEDNEDPEMEKLLSFPLESGGKRLRPALTLLSCLASGGKLKDAIYPAAGLELLHNYTLIIDDIIDNSILRRGKKTTWVQFGKSIAQCIAISYSANIFHSISKIKNFRNLSDLYIKALKTISHGEILDILFERIGREDESFITSHRYKVIRVKDYFRMIAKKTAILFEVSCEVGGICANANPKVLESLRNYGHNLGMAFQITDDILDIFGDEKKFGKRIGKDVEEKKGGNIILLYCREELSGQRLKDFLRILKKKIISRTKIKQIVGIIQTTSALIGAIRNRDYFIEQAKQSIRCLKDTRERKKLINIADIISHRQN